MGEGRVGGRPDGWASKNGHNGGMAALEHLSPSLRVADADRRRVEETLKDAYCDGRLDESEFDQRLGLAMTAKTRRDLAECTAGLPLRPVAPLMPRLPDAHRGTGVGAIAHYSGLLTWIFGPLVLYSMAQPGSPVRREAAKAFNFQLVAGVLALVTSVVGGLLLGDAVGILMVLGWVGWLTLTIVGGARAQSGQPWTNPVHKVFPQALDPRR